MNCFLKKAIKQPKQPPPFTIETGENNRLFYEETNNSYTLLKYQIYREQMI
ncbi:hypothetical protein DGWBC_1534 [Dehalogenimonas sp. WBC-2]|nr:hypothetical protein DGWBC_1534 [Dehalogenimonas sp. WBC-2]